MGSPDEPVATGKPQYPWHAESVDECVQNLGLSNSVLKSGLSSEEAQKRLHIYGPNKLSEKEQVTLLQRIWHQVANMLVGILVVVAIVSAARALTSTTSSSIVSNWLQVALILIVITYVYVYSRAEKKKSICPREQIRQAYIVACSYHLPHMNPFIPYQNRINTIIGVVQEGSAEKAADALKAMLSSEAVCIRNGKEVKVPGSEIVPGDIVKLGLGDRVPADLRLFSVSNLACGEAALTGESVPIEKKVEAIVSKGGGDPMSTPLGDRSNMCFSATLVSQGSGVGIVTTTGDFTEIGTINALVNKVETKKTNVLEQIDKISTFLAFFIFITGAAAWCVAYFITGESIIEAVSTALVCAVAMIPEGLEAMVTVTYGWAVSNMAKQNAIIRALPTVETLGSVTVICSDKTGTLTKNEMTLTAFVTSGKRFRFDMEASSRTPTNFEVDNDFLTTRANIYKSAKANEVIKMGPSAARKSVRSSFPFGITVGFGATAHGGVEPIEPTPMLSLKEEEEDALDTFSPMKHIGATPDSDYLRRALGGGILCSKCTLGTNGSREGEIGNPTELAILRAAYWGDVNVSDVKDSAPVLAEVPFSSEYKFMATIHEPVTENDYDEFGDSLVVHVKGAPDRMVPLVRRILI
jgi:magnesium-transporting ATPase (P-type)